MLKFTGNSGVALAPRVSPENFVMASSNPPPPVNVRIAVPVACHHSLLRALLASVGLIYDQDCWCWSTGLGCAGYIFHTVLAL